MNVTAMSDERNAGCLTCCAKLPGHLSRWGDGVPPLTAVATARLMTPTTFTGAPCADVDCTFHSCE